MGPHHRTGCVLAAVLMLTSSLSSAGLARAAAPHSRAHDDTYDSVLYDPGLSSDYSGVTIGPASDFYYDPGSSCDASICDTAFYDPNTNFYYDPTNQTSIDSNGAFDNYILGDATAPVDSGSAIGMPNALAALGHDLRAAAAGGHALPARVPGAQTLPAALARSISRAIVPTARPGLATAGTHQRPALVSTLIHERVPSLAGSASALGGKPVNFVDSARTYKLTYPDDWRMITHNAYVKGAYVDSRIAAPDGNAGVAAQSMTLPQGMPFSLNNANVMQYFNNAFMSSLVAFGAQATLQADMQVRTTVTGDEVLVARMPFQWVDVSLAPDVFTGLQNGYSGAIVFIVLHNNGRLHVVTGTIADLDSDTAAADAAQVTSVVSSLDLLHTYLPSGPLARIVDTTRTYGLAYPTASWSHLKPQGAGSIVLQAKDHLAGVAGASWAAPKGMGRLTAGYMQQVVAALAPSLGTIQGTPSFGHVTYKKTPRFTASFTFRRSDGHVGKAMVVAAMHHARINAVAGVAMTPANSPARQDAGQLSFIVSSMHLK